MHTASGLRALGAVRMERGVFVRPPFHPKPVAASPRTSSEVPRRPFGNGRCWQKRFCSPMHPHEKQVGRAMSSQKVGRYAPRHMGLPSPGSWIELDAAAEGRATGVSGRRRGTSHQGQR
eukprot:scaffold27150_cov147-Isochrysis_galbana.AAC.2